MTASELLQQAASCHRAGQFEQAESLYRSILQVQPEQPDANHNLGLLAMQAGQPAAALPHLQRAWIMHPQREKFCLTLTECLLQLERPQEALHIIRQAPQQHGSGSARAGWLLQLATSLVQGVRPALAADHEIATLFKAGQHAALEQRLAFLLARHPHWGEGWSALCTVRQVQGKDADDALERALRLMPDNADSRKQRKVFCIGANKTGTKTMYAVFRSLGLIIGNQGHAETLIHDWARQDYRRIIRHCQSAQAFQDVPFSLDGTYLALDQAYPAAKFILTVRNDADQWFDSLVRFLSMGMDTRRVPTAADLRQYDHCYPGYIFSVLQLSIDADESHLFDRKIYTQWYEAHNDKIKLHFRDRPDDLLVLNVAEPDAMERLTKFLDFPYSGQKMPHYNSSRD